MAYYPYAGPDGADNELTSFFGDSPNGILQGLLRGVKRLETITLVHIVVVVCSYFALIAMALMTVGANAETIASYDAGTKVGTWSIVGTKAGEGSLEYSAKYDSNQTSVTYLYFARGGNTRINLMKVTIERATTTGIEKIAELKADNGVMYNLAGQKVGAGFKGLVIKNGKKIVVK